MLLSSGQACSYPMRGSFAKYGSFAYSSAYAYSVPTGHFSLEQYALASQLGVSDDGGEFWKTRRTCEYAAIEQREDKPVLVSIWKPFPDVQVKTWLIPPTEETPNWHIRAHEIQAGREVMTADGAFAISNVNAANGRYLDVYDAARHEGTQPKIIGNYDVNTPAGWCSGAKGSFAVSQGAVGIRALEQGAEKAQSDEAGQDARRANLVNADPNSNLVESRTVIPTLQATIRAGRSVGYVTGVYAKPGGPKEEYLDGWEKPPMCPQWLLKEMAAFAS